MYCIYTFVINKIDCHLILQIEIQILIFSYCFEFFRNTIHIASAKPTFILVLAYIMN